MRSARTCMSDDGGVTIPTAPEGGSLDRRRVLGGWLLAVPGTAVLTAALVPLHRGPAPTFEAMLFLALAVVGGAGRRALAGGGRVAARDAVAQLLLHRPGAHAGRRQRPQRAHPGAVPGRVPGGRLGRRLGGPPPAPGHRRPGRGEHPGDAQPDRAARRVRRTPAARAGPGDLRGRVRRAGAARPPGAARRLGGAGHASSRCWCCTAPRSGPPTSASSPRSRATSACSASGRSWPGRPPRPGSSRPATARVRRCSPRSRTTCAPRWPGCRRRPRRCGCTTSGWPPRTGPTCCSPSRSPPDG